MDTKLVGLGRKRQRTVYAPPRWRSLVSHFLWLQVLMGVGALVCLLLGRILGASPEYAAVYYPGSPVFAIGDVLLLTAPVAGWIMLRVRDWRRTLGLAMAMIAPVALVVVVGELVGFDYLLWLVTGMYPVMTAGTIGYLLYSWNDFQMGWTRRHPAGSS